ncbi:MAG: hypothetical protein Q4Q22_05705 [Methanosphaera sp.]|nr:hypothetical protein [Methanosphaera sp.]
MASRLATFIVGFILPGLGYLFSKNYLFAIGTFLVVILLGSFNSTIGNIGAFVIWLYALIDADRKVQQLNELE